MCNVKSSRVYMYRMVVMSMMGRLQSQQGYMFNIKCHCYTGAHLPRKRAGYQQEAEARQEEERNAFWGEAAESGVRR